MPTPTRWHTADPQSRLESRGVAAHVEAILFGYERMRREMEEIRADVATHGMAISLSSQVASRSGSGAWFDPTGMRGSLLVQDARMRELERQTGAVELMLRSVTPEIVRLYHLYYHRRRPTLHCAAELSISVSTLHCAAELSISVSTLHRYRRGIICAVAQALGWADSLR